MRGAGQAGAASVTRTALLGLAVLLALVSCRREERELRLDPPVTSALDGARLMPNRISGAPPEVFFALGKPYETNAYALIGARRSGCEGRDNQDESDAPASDCWEGIARTKV
jgi:hypothetical protein